MQIKREDISKWGVSSVCVTPYANFKLFSLLRVLWQKAKADVLELPLT